MYYHINEIKLHIGEPESHIPKLILRRLGSLGRALKVTDYRITKESVDARKKDDILIVYSVDFSVARLNPDDKREVVLELPEAKMAAYELPEGGEMEMKGRPVICGFGPCGMFAGLVLASAGYRPLIIERGACMEQRTKDVANFWENGVLLPESNVQFGEGGAGTFSDGKLTTNIKDSRITKVLEEFVEAGADSAILYKHKPHIGTDVLRDVVVNIRKKIIKLGGEVRFDTRLESIAVKDGCLQGISLSNGESIETGCLILAIGHSSRDTFRMLCDAGLEMQQKPFSIGLRIRHPQELINDAQYGHVWREVKLPPAEYKLSYHSKESGRGTYTFCMCPGGEVIAASSMAGCTVTNGMSYNARDGKYANSAVLVDVRTSDFGSDHPLAGIEFQEKYEHLAYVNAGESYTPPSCSWEDFAAQNAASKPVAESLPAFAKEAILEAMPHFARKLKGFDDPDAALFAVESRSSSPVRIVRDESLNASVRGIFPAGEGPGYAGGIVSAAVDGIKCAEEIIRIYRP